METLFCNKISEYLDANKLLSSYQYGFRLSRSTLSQLLLVNAKFIGLLITEPVLTVCTLI